MLGVDEVGANLNFFDLGGHSLLLLQVQHQLAEELGHDVPMIELFRYTTVRALAERLGGQTDGRPEPARGARRRERIGALAAKRRRS